MKVLRHGHPYGSYDQKPPVAAVFEYSLSAAAPDPYSGRGYCEAFYRNRAGSLPQWAHVGVARLYPCGAASSSSP